MERLIYEVKRTYVTDIVFIVVGAILLGIGILRNELLFSVFGGFILLLGLYILYISLKKNKLYKYILENYKTNPQECMDIISKEINDMKKSIEVDQRKADAGGRDAKDSAGDVVRKTASLNKLVAVKEEIEKYI